MKEKVVSREHVVKINGAAARTKGQGKDRNKEQYYYVYDNPYKFPKSK